jgi:hypothetical protein
MFKKIKEFFVGKPVEVSTPVPYKVETYVPPVTVEPPVDEHQLAVQLAQDGVNAGKTNEQMAVEINSKYGKSFTAQNVADFIAANNIVASTPVVDQVAVVSAAEGSALSVEPEKKARKLRTPKAETAVKEKAPAKAKAPKLTVVKAEKKPNSKKA